MVVAYRASCPSCGGPVEFQLGATLLKVCGHCGTAVARKGADLANYGKVAALIPTPSVLKLGLRGDWEGAPPFTLVGRLQLDHGQGTWDEWLMAFEDGSWAWLSESQGKFHYMGQAPVPPLPDFDDVRVGQAVDLGPAGAFVAEVRRARFMTAAGELPFDVAPGSELRYVDLSGKGGQFGTVDYGSGTAPEAVYVGREVTLASFGFSEADLPTEEDRQRRVSGEDLKCPQCSGPLEVRAPDQSQRIACPYCGSLLDATKDLEVLEAQTRPDMRPLVPLGSKGTLREVEWTAIGAMERSVTVEGVRYPWREYLLYEPRSGFRWLVEAKGHWSFVEPVNVGDVSDMFGRPSFGGETFSHFQSGTATVDKVIGEFYWAVSRADQTQTDDYISAPHMLSKEVAESEVTWSRGTYLEPREVWDAFHLPGEPPEKTGVGPHQPNPAANPSRSFLTAFAALGVLIALYVMFSMASKSVHRQSVDMPPTVKSGAPEAVTFAGPIFVPSHGNLEVSVQAPVRNSWLYLDGALINDETGAVDDFDVEVSYYHGSDADGAWSEGSPVGSRFIGSVPPGRYTLRLAPQWGDTAKPPGTYLVTVTHAVPRFFHVFLAAVALMAWPFLALWRYMRFEGARWSESDHPWFEASDGGDDEEE